MSATQTPVPLSAAPSEEIVDFQSVRSSVGEISRQSALFFSSTLFALACNYFFKVFVARELGVRLIGWNALGMGIYSIAKLTGQMRPARKRDSFCLRLSQYGRFRTAARILLAGLGVVSRRRMQFRGCHIPVAPHACASPFS
jgi:hypothetical protein